jgi:undecaprenyl-diphosphatase
MPIYFTSILLGLVEGLTEFIPVSSTGHLIVADHWLGFSELVGAGRAELFEVVIQLGAIFAIGFLYRAQLIGSLVARSPESKAGRLRNYLIVAFLPAAIIGYLFHDAITKYLFSPLTVAISLIVGGIVILVLERMLSAKPASREIEAMTLRDAVIVGMSQVLSLIPGVSRSGATIMGGYAGGLSRRAATEFSFLVAFPIMVAASGYELLKYRDLLTEDFMMTLSLGFAVSFISAIAVVKWLIRYVQRHNFNWFGVYRIIAGIVILIVLAL